jgi:hypothetical protein
MSNANENIHVTLLKGITSSNSFSIKGINFPCTCIACCVFSLQNVFESLVCAIAEGYQLPF